MPFQELAEWTGLEPATPGVTGRYSNRLNYHSASVAASPDYSGKRSQTWAILRLPLSVRNLAIANFVGVP